MKVDIDSKKEKLAELIAGKVVEQAGVSVCVKGSVQGFPATLQAVYPGWPFGVMYILETSDNAASQTPSSNNASRITLYPRVGRGLGSFFTFLFLFEGKSMPVGDKRLEDQFNFVYDNREPALYFTQLEGVADQLRQLESQCRFSELVVRTDAGIYLAQPNSFEALDTAMCQQTFNLMACLASVLKANFQA